MKVIQRTLNGSFTEMNISFENPVSRETALAEIEARNFFGYHPSGYGFYNLRPKLDDYSVGSDFGHSGVYRDWRWERANSCD